MSCGCLYLTAASKPGGSSRTRTPVQAGFRLLKAYYSTSAIFLDVPIVAFEDNAWPVDDAGIVYNRAENANAFRDGYIYAIEYPDKTVRAIRWQEGHLGGSYDTGFNGEWLNRDIFLQGMDNAPERPQGDLDLLIAEESVLEEVTHRYMLNQPIDVPTVAAATGFSQTIVFAALSTLSQKGLVASNFNNSIFWRR